MPTVELPIWLNGYELVAWVRYRDAAIVRLADCHAGLAGQNIYRTEPKVGSVEDASAALQSGKLIGFGSIKGDEFAPIPAVEWTRIEIAPLDARRQHPYTSIRYSRADVLRIFPSLVPRRKLPRLTDGALSKWWSELESEVQRLAHDKLLELCQAAHPNNSVARRRIRDLAPDRKRGPKPLRRKETAELPPK